VDGKLASVLVRAAHFAASYCTSGRHALTRYTHSDGTTSSGQQALKEYRDHPVRRLVRDLVLRYPLLLGTSLERMEDRFACAAASGVDWDAYLTILRRSSAKHVEWKVGSALSSTSSVPLLGAPERIVTMRGSVVTVVPEEAELLSEETAMEIVRNAKRKVAKKRKQVKQVASPAERKRAANLRQVLLWRRQVKQNSIVFPAFPDVVHTKAIFRNERRQMSESTRKALNDLLPYQFLTLE
jgi:hypothetical protein